MLSKEHKELAIIGRQNFPLSTTTKAFQVNGKLDNYQGFGIRQEGPEERNTTTSPSSCNTQRFFLEIQRSMISKPERQTKGVQHVTYLALTEAAQLLEQVEIQRLNKPQPPLSFPSSGLKKGKNWQESVSPPPPPLYYAQSSFFNHNIKQTQMHIEDSESRRLTKVWFCIYCSYLHVFSHACLSVPSRRENNFTLYLDS